MKVLLFLLTSGVALGATCSGFSMYSRRTSLGAAYPGMYSRRTSFCVEEVERIRASSFDATKSGLPVILEGKVVEDNWLEWMHRLKSVYDFQVLACWIQLHLNPECCNDKGAKFKKTELWYEKSKVVDLLIKAIELAGQRKKIETDSEQKNDVVVTSCLEIYSYAYTRLTSDNKIIPGYGNTRCALLQPDRLKRRVLS